LIIMEPKRDTALPALLEATVARRLARRFFIGQECRTLVLESL
jgi:hypothetical protein